MNKSVINEKIINKEVIYDELKRVCVFEKLFNS